MRNSLAEATRRDLPEMCAIFKCAQIYHHEMFPQIFCMPDDEDSIRTYIGGFFKSRHPLRRGTRTRFARGWFENDRLGGYMLYQFYSSTNVFFGPARWFAHIDDIAVSDEYRQRGVGDALMNALTEDMERAGGGILSGQIWAGNDASQNLFKKNGYDASAQHFYRAI